MSEYPINSTARVYYDAEDRPCTLAQMIKNEPEWAENRIREGEKAIAERDALAAQIKYTKALAEDAYGSYAACHDSECASALTRLIAAEEPPK